MVACQTRGEVGIATLAGRKDRFMLAPGTRHAIPTTAIPVLADVLSDVSDGID